MITVKIIYIAFVEKDADGKGARVAFPHAGHTLEILHGNRSYSGSRIAIEVLRNGAPAVADDVAGLPMGGRVFSIEGVAGRNGTIPYRLKPEAQLARLTQAILHLPGGTFAAKDPSTASRYADDHWDVGGGNARQLTDTVEWTIEPKTEHSYGLKIDGTVVATLSDGDVVTFTNNDPADKYFFDNGNNQVEIIDVHDLYSLVTPPPKLRPTPKTPYRGPFVPVPPQAHTPEGQAAIEAARFFGGDLPLCPVGEPGDPNP